MPKVNDPKLYEEVKRYADTIYKKPSAYKSGFIQKRYKELGGTYSEDNKPKKLKQWFKEEWADVGGKEYPVYRPSVRINKDTPLLASEISPGNLKQQIRLKQKIRGRRNLPPFKSVSP
jgi:hypothetical protein